MRTRRRGIDASSRIWNGRSSGRYGTALSTTVCSARGRYPDSGNQHLTLGANFVGVVFGRPFILRLKAPHRDIAVLPEDRAVGRR